MPRRAKTGFDKFFDDQAKSPAFAKEYAKARAEVDAIDGIVRALDVARQNAGMTKVQLARAVGAPPETVRRLFTAKKPNPTLSTLFRLAAAIGCRLELVPDGKPRRAPPARAGAA